MAIEIAPPDLDLPETRKRRRDMRALWRVSAWGCAAAVALAALAITTQTEGGSERLALAIKFGNPPVRATDLADLTLHMIEKDAEAHALEAQVVTLAADRDRLAARLASLEHNLDDMTGSIKRQAALAASAPESPATTPQIISPIAMSPTKDTGPSRLSDATVQGAVSVPEAIPLPPARMASAPADESAVEQPAKPEFGIDLGGARNLEVLNARWIAVKANFGPLLSGLHPLAAHDHRLGSTDFRLLVGPLANPAVAMQLCARFAAARVTCRTAKFDGEQFAQR
jgi:hypothetical protein